MIVHYFFDLMVSMGVFCFIISGLYMLILFFKKLRKFKVNKAMLYAILLTGPTSLLAIEFGWFLTEMGRQPWIIRVICVCLRLLHSRWYHVSYDSLRYIVSRAYGNSSLCTYSYVSK